MTSEELLSDSPSARRAAQLISALFDERLTAEEQVELESLLLADSHICELYVCLAHLHAGLYKYASALGNVGEVDLPLESALPAATGPVTDNLLMNETMVLPALSPVAPDGGGSRFDEELFAPAPYSPLQNRTERYNWYLPAGIAASLVMALSLIFYLKSLSHPPAPSRVVVQGTTNFTPLVIPELPPPVATLTVVSKPVWDQSYPPSDGKFEPGQSLMLASGVVQLKLNGGGRLVVEGPANLQFSSYAKFVLHRGKVVAVVPGGGLIIQCPNGSITDLGTEFGVEVRANGAAEVAVFKGSVSASLNSIAKTQGVSNSLLTVGQAAVITNRAIARSAEGAIPQRYITSLDNGSITSLDVTDLVSGGDGTTQRRGIAIDSTNGEIGDLIPRANRNGDGKYHPILGYPVLDGTFIPDGALDQMVVDSAGDRYKFTTACNTTHNLIETGGHIRWDDGTGICTALSGVDYATPGHGIICTHSNNGLTLNLNVVRRLYPNREINRFRCVVGNSYINGWHRAYKVNPVAGAFVLINGKARFEKPRFTNQDGGILVDIPIGIGDRFLTLAATDAGTDIDQQWIMWADAFLEFAKSSK